MLLKNRHCSYSWLEKEFASAFYHSTSPDDASNWLLRMRQRQQSVADYSGDFCISATEGDLEDRALRGMFHHSLNDQMKN